MLSLFSLLLFLAGCFGGKSSSFGKVLRWRFLTNVMIPITKVSATGRPINSSDAVGLLLKKHVIHIPLDWSLQGGPFVKISLIGCAEPSFEVRFCNPQFHSIVDKKE